MIKVGFKILLIKIINLKQANNYLEQQEITFSSNTLVIFHIPYRYVNGFQDTIKPSNLLIMADYIINKILDEFKFS